MKFKKFLSLLASLAMTVTAVTGAMTASASEVANGTCGDLTWTLDSDGKLTISGEGEMASPKITDVVNVGDGGSVSTTGFTVEGQLGEYPDVYTYKAHKDDIKEVVIEEGVTAIGFCAFYKMSSIETVTLPSTIKEFKGVGYMRGTAVPNSHTVNNAHASYAFAECTSLKSLTLTEGMTSIGAYAFYGCTSLESVRIPTTMIADCVVNGQNLKNGYGWGPYSFADCSNLKNIILPEGLKVMGSGAFVGTAVESVVIPSTIETWVLFANNKFTYNEKNGIFDLCGAFGYCEKLSSVTFTEGIKNLQNSKLFYNCPKLTRIVIPKSVANLQSAFMYFRELEEVYIEEGAQIPVRNARDSYFDHSFEYCENLKKIEMFEGVNTISNNTWCTGCNSLTDVYVHGMNSSIGGISDSVTIHCDFGSKIYNSTSIKNNKEIISDDIENALKELNTAVTEAEKYAEKDYTTESYETLKTALENAKKYDESYTGVLPLQWAAEDISNAINSLVKKPAQAVKPGTTKPSNDNKITNTKSQAQKNAENAMKQAKITKLTVKSKAKKKITVTWKKVSKANGYQVQVSTNKKFKKSKIILTKTTSKKKITIKKLKSKKTYFVRVRAYATYKDSNGKPQKVYSSWIKKTRKVKVK